MRLMEDLHSLPIGQPVIIPKEVNNIGIPPVPKQGSIITPPLPKKRIGGSIEKLEMLIEIKKQLLNRKQYKEVEYKGEKLNQYEMIPTDIPYLDEQQQKQFEEEINTIRKQINKIKGE